MIESRLLRYFVAVAEELHFGRAAERLGIAAPALSRAIAQLEAQLNVTLFERSTRHVELTVGGTTLLDEASRVLEAVEAAERRTRRAAGGDHRLALALKADLDAGLLEPIFAAFDRPVNVILCNWGEQGKLVRDGRADVALMPAPLDDPALDFEVLREEPHLVALAAGHPLTERSILRLADLDAALRRTDLPILWTPAGGAAPPIADITQLLWLVESGELAALLPASVAARYERPQLVYRRVVDAPPARLAVAWPRSSRSLATASFVRAAVDAAADISDSTTSSRLA